MCVCECVIVFVSALWCKWAFLHLKNHETQTLNKFRHKETFMHLFVCFVKVKYKFQNFVLGKVV